MAIKIPGYKRLSNSKKDLVMKMGGMNKEDMVHMKKSDFVKEHKHLVKVLRTGSKQQQEEEAESQAQELQEHLSGAEPKDE